MYTMIYPERRQVTEAQLRTWHADATADGRIGMYLEGTDYPRGGQIAIADIIFDLEDIGDITLADDVDHG
jgi:hypothetical protein